MPSRWKSYLERMAIRKDERGQGLVEYALIIALIAVVIVASIQLFEVDLENAYNTIKDALP